MAKSKVVARPQVRHRRRPADTEHTMRLLVVGGVIAVVVGAVALIGFGWYWTHIKPLGKNVLQVGTISYDLGALERRMKLIKSGSSFYTQNQSAAAQLPDGTAAIVRRYAERGVRLLDYKQRRGKAQQKAMELLVRYGRTLDTKDAAGYAGLFAPDAVRVTNNGAKTQHGRAEIQADIQQSMDGWRTTIRHFLRERRIRKEHGARLADISGKRIHATMSRSTRKIRLRPTRN